MKSVITPIDFLKQLKKTEVLEFEGRRPTPEYLRIHLKQEKQVGASGVDPEMFLDKFFTDMLGLIVKVLPQPLQSEVAERVVVGCVNNSEVNAHIMRHDETECYAILINKAIITMISHYVKLVVAANNPSSVVYCNGLPVNTLTRSCYIEMANKLLDDYRNTWNPIGPMLKFNLDSNAMVSLDATLKLIYLFLLGHEVAHYINGDLKKPNSFTACKSNPDIFLFGANVSHSMEYSADKQAFELVLRVLCVKTPDSSARLVFDSSVTLFFNFFRQISDMECATHPQSSKRIILLTKTFFGDAAARIMEKSFNDLTQIEVFRKTIGKQTIAEVLQKYNQNRT